MKKKYETAEINVFLFEKSDTIVASGVVDSTEATTIDTDETDIL